jgi:DNA invertase Pin-like site-specific DNA recombinase
MLTVLGGLAEFERDLIRARTGEGRARAVARGQKMGRPLKLTDHQKREAIKRRNQGETLADIARSYHVSPATISRLPPWKRLMTRNKSRSAADHGGKRTRKLPTYLKNY